MLLDAIFCMLFYWFTILFRYILTIVKHDYGHLITLIICRKMLTKLNTPEPVEYSRIYKKKLFPVNIVLNKSFKFFYM